MKKRTGRESEATKGPPKKATAKATTGGALLGAHAPGATPLTPDDLVGLRFPVTTHGELNELEAENILSGWRWALRSTKSRMPEMLTGTFLRQLHKQMLGEVWEWAGQYRLLELANIGVDPSEIAPTTENRAGRRTVLGRPHHVRA
jgi:hypothetical protein